MWVCLLPTIHIDNISANVLPIQINACTNPMRNDAILNTLPNYTCIIYAARARIHEHMYDVDNGRTRENIQTNDTYKQSSIYTRAHDKEIDRGENERNRARTYNNILHI